MELMSITNDIGKKIVNWRNGDASSVIRDGSGHVVCCETSDFVAIFSEFRGLLATTFCHLATSELSSDFFLRHLANLAISS